MARAKRPQKRVQERRIEGERDNETERQRKGVSGKREKARNVWRFGVMRFNYKTRRVLQLARRRTPHPRPSFTPPAPPPRPSRSLSFPPFRSYLRFDSPYLPSHPQLRRPFSRSSPRPVPRKLNPSPPVKDSRTERAATDPRITVSASTYLPLAAGGRFQRHRARYFTNTTRETRR